MTDTRKNHHKLDRTARDVMLSIEQSLLVQLKQAAEATEKAQETTKLLAANLARVLKENDSLRRMLGEMTIERLNHKAEQNYRRAFQ